MSNKLIHPRGKAGSVTRDDRMLEGVGLTEQEEALYSMLIDRPSLSLSELAATLGKTRDKVRSLAESLEIHGLLSRSTGKPVRFMPTSPELALEGIIIHRQEELDAARLAARQLEERFRRSVKRESPADIVEAVASREAVAQRFMQLQRGAKTEVLGFDKPPYATAPTQNQEIEAELLRRGVLCKAVYERTALERPGALKALAADIAAGEEARAAPRLPTKLMIVDRRVALLPFSSEPFERVEGALIVYPSSLLDSLVVLWDTIWEHATPITPAGGSDSKAAGDPALSTEDQHLVMLLLAGLKARAIARQMGMGISTVERRTKKIIEMLGAETRFQAGFQLARSGLIDSSE